jgi:TatD DNase family protein
MLIDIHTHRRRGGAIEVVSVMAGRTARQAAAGAAGTVAAGAKSAARIGDPRAAELAGTASVAVDLPEPPFSIGIHPWQLSGDGFDPAEALREVETAPAAAIGEIGLDFALTAPATDHGEQKMIFAAQLRIAEARRLPVVLHCVRAFEPTMEILAGFQLKKVIFHGFIGSPEQAARAVRSGYSLSFGERSLTSPKTVEALRVTPLENIFLETDDAPVTIADVYTRAAAILAVPLARLQEQLQINYKNSFTLNEK